MLVRLGVFEKIKLSFLPKGHTHNDVDQMFGCLADVLRYKDIYTLDDIHTACASAYGGNLKFIHLDQMASISTWLDPFLPKGMTGYTKRPRCFVFRKDAEGVVRHKYRLQLQTTCKGPLACNWMPHNDPGYVLLKKVPDTASICRVPFKPVDVDSLRKTAKAIAAYCSEVQKKWWQDLLNRFALEDSVSCPTCVSIRQTQKDNARCHTDSKDLARDKSNRWAKSRKEMFRHLAAPGGPHSRFDGLLFPPARAPAVESEAVAELDEDFVNHLDELQEDGVEEYFINKRSRRVGNRPEQLKTGMLCVVRCVDDARAGVLDRPLDSASVEHGGGLGGSSGGASPTSSSDLSSPDESSDDEPLAHRVSKAAHPSRSNESIDARPPSSQGRKDSAAKSRHREPSHSLRKCVLKVHEYGNPAADMLKPQKRCFKSAGNAKDQYLKVGARPGKGFKPVYTDVNVRMLLDWGEPKDILKPNGKILPAVLTAVSNNPNTPWTLAKADEFKGSYLWYIAEIVDITYDE